MDIAREDYNRYYNKDLPQGFSSVDMLKKHNDEVVAQTIKKADAIQTLKKKTKREGLKERTSALASYLTSTQFRIDPTYSLEKYFGPKYLAHLRGQKIIQRLKKFADGKSYIELDSID